MLETIKSFLARSNIEATVHEEASGSFCIEVSKGRHHKFVTLEPEEDHLVWGWVGSADFAPISRSEIVTVCAEDLLNDTDVSLALRTALTN